MKEKIVALFLACFIAMGLSACDAGTKKPANDNDVMGDEHSNTQQNTPSNNTNNKLEQIKQQEIAIPMHCLNI